ncbi:MAG: hypothetical protein WCQ99_01230 [Pseudomonadota bacterium]
MQTYLIDLNINSGFITPWHADTIFGHLCWVAERHTGFENFKGAAGLIDLYRKGEPPFIVSDAFPDGFLPAPANLKELFAGTFAEGLTIDKYSALKKVKETEYITIDQLQSYQRGTIFDFKDFKKPFALAVTLHNQINRMSNTTGEHGSLFELDEKYVKAGKLNVYVKISDGFKNDVIRLFDLFAAGGFGKKKSSGKGAFKINRFEECGIFEGIDSPNGFVCLSHFIPAPHDPAEGFYKTTVKYGKMGEEKSLGGNPFKKPLLMIKPGAVFKTDTVKSFYGRLMENIAYSDASVVQYGFAFPVPVKIS